MAFGKELEQFVASFQAGYKMAKDPDEEKRKDAAERRAEESHEWGREEALDTRNFRNETQDWREQVDTRDYESQQERYGVADQQWGAEFDWRKATNERDFGSQQDRYERSDYESDRAYEADRSDQSFSQDRYLRRDERQDYESDRSYEAGRDDTRFNRERTIRADALGIENDEQADFYREREERRAQEAHDLNLRIKDLAIQEGFTGNTRDIPAMLEFFDERGITAPEAPEAEVEPMSSRGAIPEDDIEATPISYQGDTPRGNSRGRYQPYGRSRPAQIRNGILDTADALGIDPLDLATVISYETAGTFNPVKGGPTTQWGQHRGLIQFGQPQAKKYGVDWDDPLGSQLGPDGAVANYLRDAGVRPGMGILDVYSAINAGGVGLYNRSDANNGGAPGTVRDKVERQMGSHRRNALRLLQGGGGGGRSISAASGGMIDREVADQTEEEEELMGPTPEEVATEPVSQRTAVPEEGRVVSDENGMPQYGASMDTFGRAHEAVRVGLERALAISGADQDSAIDDPELDKARANNLRGYGAAPATMMQQVKKAIDPEGTMVPAERNMKAVGAVYQYYLDQGDTEKAKEAAASMVQHYRQASTRFAAIARAAAEDGDLDAAAKAAVAAYANIPNGQDLQIEPTEGGYSITVTGADGEQLEAVVLKPQEFAATAMAMDTFDFDGAILDAAGLRAAPKDREVLSPNNRAELADIVDGTLEAHIEETGETFDQAQSRAIREAATNIAGQAENQMDPGTAARLVIDLTSMPKEGDPVKPYTARPSKDYPGQTEVTVNGTPFLMSTREFTSLENMRAKNEQAYTAAGEKEAAYARGDEDQAALLGTFLNKSREVLGGIRDSFNEHQERRREEPRGGTPATPVTSRGIPDGAEDEGTIVVPAVKRAAGAVGRVASAVTSAPSSEPFEGNPEWAQLNAQRDRIASKPGNLKPADMQALRQIEDRMAELEASILAGERRTE